MKTQKDEFISFLKKHYAFKGFVRAYGQRDFIFESEEFFKFTDPCSYIQLAFIWKKTKEGRKYWDRLNGLWLNLINNK